VSSDNLFSNLNESINIDLKMTDKVKSKVLQNLLSGISINAFSNRNFLTHKRLDL